MTRVTPLGFCLLAEKVLSIVHWFSSSLSGRYRTLTFCLNPNRPGEKKAKAFDEADDANKAENAEMVKKMLAMDFMVFIVM